MKQVGDRRVWTVAEIAGAIFRRIEDVPSVWIEAEVTNLSRRGGQVYLTLVDHSGEPPHQIDASMNGVVYDRLPSPPRDGTLVHAYGRVEMWVPRSQLRFRVARLELTGDGLLLARIEELRRRLAAEGLTDDARKRPLPVLPRRIGLVTSGEGAARADFLTNVTARFPAARVLVVRSLVQGDDAPRELVRAIRHLDGVDDVDVIVLARGGGALEDLMAFNSEAVCRAVAACGTPVVSAIGHESDVTVCDLVADLRVSTPTKAAEAVVPEAVALARRLDAAHALMTRALHARVTAGAELLARQAGRLRTGLAAHGRAAQAQVAGTDARLVAAVRGVARGAGDRLGGAARELERSVRGVLEDRTARLERLGDLHQLLSPARTVARGYAIVRMMPQGGVIADARSLHAGDRLELELRDGVVGAHVDDVRGTDG